MKLSDRDKKLLLILGIVLVVVVPLLFVFKPLAEDVKDEKTKMEASQKTLDELKAKDAYRATFQENIDKMLANIADIMKDFDGRLNQEDVILYARECAEELPFLIDAMSFSDTTEIPISVIEKDGTGASNTKEYTFLMTQTAIEVLTEYDAFKAYLDEITNNEYAMSVVGVDVEYDDETGRIKGTYLVSQYAIAGDGREYRSFEIPAQTYLNEGTIFGKYVEELTSRYAKYPELMPYMYGKVTGYYYGDEDKAQNEEGGFDSAE